MTLGERLQGHVLSYLRAQVNLWVNSYWCFFLRKLFLMCFEWHLVTRIILYKIITLAITGNATGVNVTAYHGTNVQVCMEMISLLCTGLGGTQSNTLKKRYIDHANHSTVCHLVCSTQHNPVGLVFSDDILIFSGQSVSLGLWCLSTSSDASMTLEFSSLLSDMVARYNEANCQA